MKPRAWSQFIRMLPFLEESSIYGQIDFDETIASQDLVKEDLPIFLCPSDGDDRLSDLTPDEDTQYDWGRNNYRGNAGNGIGMMYLPAGVTGVANEVELAADSGNPKLPQNGVFTTNKAVKMSEITDGTSHTALFSEMVRGDGEDIRVEVPGDWFKISESNITAAQVYTACAALNVATMNKGNAQFSKSGRNWVRGNYVTARYTHIMPPNERSCARKDGNIGAGAVNDNGGATTASSRHPGGVNLTFVDGSGRFATSDIDLAIWQALGSRNGGEVVDSAN
jgi:prepilin-type processing-associated H-X9-DG protein